MTCSKPVITLVLIPWFWVLPKSHSGSRFLVTAVSEKHWLVRIR